MSTHWHGARSVAGPVDEGGCCAGEAEWGLSVTETATGATHAPRTTTDTTGPQIGAQRREEDA